MTAILLFNIFANLVPKYTDDQNIAHLLWAEIENHYNSSNRHYHNLQHLQNMYEQLLQVKDLIQDWDTILFSLFYHDIIYNATAKDNEEQSADVAEKRLLQIAYPPEKIQLCVQQIMATKTHTVSLDTDTNYFTDADLSILGSEWSAYEAYTKAIRKEYSIYPNLLYKPGRRKMLQHFLGMDKIYKTGFFQQKYESVAKENMERELLSLL
jgi:predicted metal-dependent HD superfamily phosphohydrolase